MSETQSFEETVAAYAVRQALFAPGDFVIAAVSGGADSMALLHVLRSRAAGLGIRLGVAHVNHGLRGAAARADAAFVQAESARLGLPFFLFDAEAEGVALPEHGSEAWARQLRYAFFEQLAACENAKIALAHTQNDQAETLLLHLARGAGLHGAGGMAPVRGVFVRPLLETTRAQVEAYCAAQGIAYVTDATNLADGYARNRVRHTALPVLESVNPEALAAMGRFCAQMRELDIYLEGQAAELLAEAHRPGGYALAVLADAPAPLLAAAMARLLRPLRDAEEKTVDALVRLVRQGHGAVSLTARETARAVGGLLRLERQRPETPAPPQPFGLGVYHLPGGFCLKAALCTPQEYEKKIKISSVHKKDLNYTADYAKMASDIVLRTREPGDAFSLPARGVSKSLKKLYNELGLPLPLRPFWPLLASGRQVVWLWGQGFTPGLAPDAHTTQVLVLSAEREETEEWE